MSRYVYLGTKETDPALHGQPWDPVLRPDGKCILGRGVRLVQFEHGRRIAVVRRRLRLQQKRPLKGSECRSK